MSAADTLLLDAVVDSLRAKLATAEWHAAWYASAAAMSARHVDELRALLDVALGSPAPADDEAQEVVH